ncbi:hypothetical protein SAMN05192569_105520 [Parageobacillus thermantarcticus]|uniref:Uncharacterized protein n=1 Tax=Parageobacillus thermantarcticus TaxID=186116 RepID=A0A1I0TSN3_9BACL|nr:hypothetical protein SAMN05192569_105520 [Parageobacillus thermantarcticus]
MTKISPSRMGPPRFGNRPHGIDTTVKTYQLTPEQLERYKNGEKLDDILKGEDTMEQQKPKVIAYAKYEEVVAERDELKKQLEELQANMEKEVAHWKELFETAMADKEQLHKENLTLENEVQRLKELVSELTERNDRYSDEWIDLHKELRALRLYALEKLQKDVYGA